MFLLTYLVINIHTLHEKYVHFTIHKTLAIEFMASSQPRSGTMKYSSSSSQISILGFLLGMLDLVGLYELTFTDDGAVI